MAGIYRGQNIWWARWGWAVKPALGFAALVLFALLGGTPPVRSSDARPVVRLGYFPNLTHAPALVGVASGAFQKELGQQGRLETALFNAGPEALEALLAGSLDAAYVGPGPATNTYVKTQGRALVVVAGACSGGAALVARRGVAISAVRDLDGKRVAIPQLGGTQDIALRRFTLAAGLLPKEKGGTVTVLPIKNPDIAGLFRRGELDAAWVPEPWVSRLVAETGAKVVVDERDLWPQGRFTTTVLVARREFLQQKPELMQALLRGHLDALQQIGADAASAQEAVNRELKRLTGKPIPAPVLAEAWKRVQFTADPNRENVFQMAKSAQDAGYLPAATPDLSAMFDMSLLGRAERSR